MGNPGKFPSNLIEMVQTCSADKTIIDPHVTIEDLIERLWWDEFGREAKWVDCITGEDASVETYRKTGTAAQFLVLAKILGANQRQIVRFKPSRNLNAPPNFTELFIWNGKDGLDNEPYIKKVLNDEKETAVPKKKQDKARKNDPSPESGDYQARARKKARLLAENITEDRDHAQYSTINVRCSFAPEPSATGAATKPRCAADSLDLVPTMTDGRILESVARDGDEFRAMHQTPEIIVIKGDESPLLLSESAAAPGATKEQQKGKQLARTPSMLPTNFQESLESGSGGGYEDIQNDASWKKTAWDKAQFVFFRPDLPPKTVPAKFCKDWENFKMHVFGAGMWNLNDRRVLKYQIDGREERDCRMVVDFEADFEELKALLESKEVWERFKNFGVCNVRVESILLPIG